MQLVKYLAHLGYGSRKQIMQLIRDGHVANVHGQTLTAEAPFVHEEILFNGQPLDPPQGMCAMLHKPIGYTCSHGDAGPLIYDLLPPRWRQRKPKISSIGRLDRDTSGLLLLTDDGALLHRLISPRASIPKCYEATLSEDLRGNETEIFASGTLLLRSEQTPLKPATMETLGRRHVRLTLYEGRYHQVRRMFAAVNNHVLTLHRHAIAGLQMNASLTEGKWTLLSPHQRTILDKSPE